jgi:hypothetical protein
MEISMPQPRARNVRTACVVALASFVGFLVVPSVVRPVLVAVMVASTLAVVILAARWMRTPPGSRALGSVAIAVVGTLVLLLSLVGLGGSAAALHE